MYACKAATERGARCRNWAEGENGFCSFHKGRKDVEIAPRPDTVLYKFNLNESWSKKLLALGVPEKHPDFEAKEHKHIQHAQQYDRDAFRYRKDVADSGVPVFGKDGLRNVSMYEVLKELAAVYEVVDIHIRPRRDGNRWMNVLVVSFSHGEKFISSDNAFQELLSFLSSSCWGYVHVWANPPQEDGRVIHTVNSSHREERKQPDLVLRLADGLWATEPAQAGE